MSAYHQNVLIERFIAGGGELPHSVVVGIGGDWYEDVKALRRRGCFLERLSDELWRMDLTTVPVPEPVHELDAGRAVDRDAAEDPPPPSPSSAHAVDGAPDVEPVPDPQVEGETEPLFETEPPSPPTPYDVEAA